MIEIKAMNKQAIIIFIRIDKGAISVNFPRFFNGFIDIEKLPNANTRENKATFEALKELVRKGATDKDIAFNEIIDLENSGYKIFERKEDGKEF